MTIEARPINYKMKNICQFKKECGSCHGHELNPVYFSHGGFATMVGDSSPYITPTIDIQGIN